MELARACVCVCDTFTHIHNHIHLITHEALTKWAQCALSDCTLMCVSVCVECVRVSVCVGVSVCVTLLTFAAEMQSVCVCVSLSCRLGDFQPSIAVSLSFSLTLSPSLSSCHFSFTFLLMPIFIVCDGQTKKTHS